MVARCRLPLAARAFETGSSRLVGVVRAAGLGKTRLIGEFSALRRVGARRLCWPL